MSKYIETDKIELTEKYSDTICKEIVSFLNAEGGTIIIGVSDDGTVVGVENVDDTFKKIADIVSTQIEPMPSSEISVQAVFEDSKTLIKIIVSKGTKHIYCQKKYGFSSRGCTIRIGTTCHEMTTEQINVRYRQKFIDNEYILIKKSSIASLSFTELKIYRI